MEFNIKETDESVHVPMGWGRTDSAGIRMTQTDKGIPGDDTPVPGAPATQAEVFGFDATDARPFVEEADAVEYVPPDKQAETA